MTGPDLSPTDDEPRVEYTCVLAEVVDWVRERLPRG